MPLFIDVTFKAKSCCIVLAGLEHIFLCLASPEIPVYSTYLLSLNDEPLRCL